MGKDMRYQGKHALITGGGQGLGSAIAMALAKEGANITIAGRDLAKLEIAAKQIGNALPLQCDVTDPKQIEELFSKAQKHFGDVDIMVANAGAAKSAPFLKTDFALWRNMLAVNLDGAFLSAKAALTQMTKKGTDNKGTGKKSTDKKSTGRVIFIASLAGLKGYAYVAPYSAAKHGVIGLTKSLALEFAKTNITINAICPGYSETPMLEASINNIMQKTGKSEKETRELLSKDNPQGRFIQPEEVAATIMWLCSDEAASINGQAISISGGEI